MKQVIEWKPAGILPPSGHKVLVRGSYTDSGNPGLIVAEHIASKTPASDYDSELVSEYSDDDDEFYLLVGWYAHTPWHPDDYQTTYMPEAIFSVTHWADIPVEFGPGKMAQ